MGAPPQRLDIGPDDGGQRVDRFLRKYLPDATLPLLFKLLRTKQVTVNGKKAQPSDRLEKGDTVEFYLGARLADLRGDAAAAGKRSPPPAPPLEILHRDEHVLAVNKPARLLVHEGDGDDEPTLVDAVWKAFPRTGHTFRPALAHRLDRDTSGVLLVGLSAEGLRGLEDALRRRRVEKTYLALVVGVPRERSGVIDVPLRRKEAPSGESPRVHVGGRSDAKAVTRWRVVGASDEGALLEVRPETGRTHQIRVHLKHIGHPILGDATYGDRRRNEEARGRFGLWRQFLHAWRVDLVHPVTGAPLRVTAPLPEELHRVASGMGLRVPRE
jgi:23S rRNA pseudouridine955/2504/2580 synthase